MEQPFEVKTMWCYAVIFCGDLSSGEGGTISSGDTVVVYGVQRR